MSEPKAPPRPTARGIALACLEAVESQDAYANLAMPPLLRASGLDARDRAFAVELAYGSIRMRGLWDAIIASASGRDPAGLDADVRRVLRLGVHQILAMRVPAHAAVGETVTLAKRSGARRAAGLINAVLRRVADVPADEWLDRVAEGEGAEPLAMRHSHPRWVVDALDEALAADGRRGEIGDLLASHNASAPVTIAARPGLSTPEEVLASAPGSSRTGLAPTAVRLGGGDPADVAAVAEGRAGVQDEGSQLAALALIAVRAVASGERWLDVCAGPGGKAALLGAAAALGGATLIANELHPHRAALVNESLRAVPAGVASVVTGDARDLTGQFDRVLLDAPCTGLGALRRRPEARWRRTPEDLAELVAVQADLLDAAVARLAPGGILAYVTCSPHLAETREQVDGVLARHAQVRLHDARTALAAVTGRPAASWGAHEAVQLWTHAHGTDAMFIALMAREAPRGGTSAAQ